MTMVNRVLFACVALMTGVVLSLPLVAVRPAQASVVPADDIDHTRLVVKLTPLDGAPRKMSLGATGHAVFDAFVADHGVHDLRQAIPPLPATHKNAANPLRRRLSEVVVLGVPDGQDPETFKKDVERLPDVEFAEFDVIARIDAAATVTPNDPYFLTHQYPLRNTGAQPPADNGTAGADLEMEAAWMYTTGDASVVLAIIDTGIDEDHPDLMDRIWYNEDETNDGVDMDGNGYISDFHGWNFVNNSNNINDDHSHGSHCAGIAAASSNNGTGMAGMDWNCRVMVLKALGATGSGSSLDVAEAITYAADNGADIISMSLGSYGASTQEESAIDYAAANNVTVFAAMGNDNVDTPHYPSAFPSVISVGATDSDDNRALPFCGAAGSNYGDYIDICAPGDWVWSTVPDGTFGYKCGTSMATPHAAGLAALIKALEPGYTPAQVRSLMRAGAEDQVGRPSEDTPGFDIYHGWGRINGRITLQALVLDFPPILSVPAAQTVTELETLEFAVSAFDSNFTIPVLSADPPTNATFFDSGNGIGVFTFTPDIVQSGAYNVMFVATDGVDADTAYVSITVDEGCLCPWQANYDESADIDAVDFNTMIDILFFSVPDIQDVGCPITRSDFNCSGLSDAVDLNEMIDYLFFNGADPCDPCLP